MATASRRSAGPLTLVHQELLQGVLQKLPWLPGPAAYVLAEFAQGCYSLRAVCHTQSGGVVSLEEMVFAAPGEWDLVFMSVVRNGFGGSVKDLARELYVKKDFHKLEVPGELRQHVYLSAGNRHLCHAGMLTGAMRYGLLDLMQIILEDMARNGCAMPSDEQTCRSLSGVSSVIGAVRMPRLLRLISDNLPRFSAMLISHSKFRMEDLQPEPLDRLISSALRSCPALKHIKAAPLAPKIFQNMTYGDILIWLRRMPGHPASSV